MRRLTAEEYYRLPENKSYRDELIRGTVCFREPPPGFRHGGVDARIGYILLAFVMPRRLGTVVHNVGFVLERNPDTVCAPDVSFIAASRLPIPSERPYPEGAPDLAVEVLSPGNKKKNMAVHVALYLRAGSRLVWVVDTKRQTITVHRPSGEPVVLGIDDELSGEDVLPEFQYRVAHVFADGL
jgi:Uma2 family endonuclease